MTLSETKEQNIISFCQAFKSMWDNRTIGIVE